MARGVTSPPPLPALATQLIKGSSNSQKDAKKAANAKTRRAITIDILTLLENSIARNETWSAYEKSLRFTVMLLAWWGTLRLGELLGSKISEYHVSTSLLASDVKFHDQKSSISIWLRNPKMAREAAGDVVEIW